MKGVILKRLRHAGRRHFFKRAYGLEKDLDLARRSPAPAAA
jgi:hypothetical protein